MAKAETEASALKITDLNDDCITEICRYLPADNLYQLHSAHKRFYIPIKNAVPSIKVEINGEEAEENIEGFLKVFGDQVRILQALNWWNTKIMDFFRWMNLYCSKNNVKDCKFTNSYLTKELMNRNSGFFESLYILEFEIIHMKSKHQNIFGTLIKDMRLEKSSSTSSAGSGQTILNELHGLMSTWDMSDDGIDKSANFSLVTKLTFLFGTYNYNMLSWFPNLVALDIVIPETFDLSIILNLNHLSELTMHLQYIAKEEQDAVISVISTFNTLKSLSLTMNRMESDDNGKTINSICAMTNLEELSLKNALPVHSSSDAHLLKIADSMTHLRRFQYEYDDNEAILCEFVRRAKQLRTLSLELMGEEKEYVDFYEELTSIREEQSNESVLYVRIFEDHPGLQSNRWVQMRTVGSFEGYDESISNSEEEIDD